MNWSIFEIAINFYQGLLCIFFMRKILCYKKKNLWIDIASVSLIGLMLSIHQFCGLSIPDTMFFAVPLIHAILFSDEKWYVCLFWTFILGIMIIGMTELFGVIVTAIWHVDWSILFEETSARLIYVIGTNIFITLMIVMLISIRHIQNTAPMSATFIFLAVLFVELLTNEIIYHLQTVFPDAKDIYVWISVCTLGAVGMIVLLYETMNAMSRRQRLSELAIRTADLNHAYQEEMKLMYQKMLADQHDLRQRLDLAEHLLENQTPSEKEHIAELLQSARLITSQASGNIAVDAILAAKESAMQHAGIRFSYSGVPLNRLPTLETDFCILLANLLDNAIEAVMRLPSAAPNRSVKLVISRTWDMLSIVCQNDMDPATIKQRGDKWLSSKPNSALHGFGTQSIRSIVEKSEGFVEFVPESSTFVVRILLPDKE